MKLSCTNDFNTNIIQTYSDMVYKLAYSLVKDRYDADDIYQEVFMRYIKKRPHFQNKEHEKAWFLRVTINCCKNMWKTPWRQRTVAFQGNENDSMPEKKTEHTFLIETVKELPEKYRVVIHLFYYEEMSVQEISQIIRTKPSTVRTQLTRARDLLREKLKEEL